MVTAFRIFTQRNRCAHLSTTPFCSSRSFHTKKLFTRCMLLKKNVKLKLGSVVFGVCAFGTYVATHNVPSDILNVYCEKTSKEPVDRNDEIIFKAKYSFKEAIRRTKDLVHRVKDEAGSPGIVVGVSVDGRTVFEAGMGYSDIENRVLCSKNTVMRIASISKSITMAAIGKLWQEGKLDLDKPVQEYVAYFPEKTFNNEKVLLTCRHLVSHLGGIRHYDKSVLKKNEEQGESEASEKKSNPSKTPGKASSQANKKNTEETGEKKEEKDEFKLKEYFLKEKFDSVKTSLDLFKDDPLIHKPGTKYLYTTHGWTLLSAVVESVAKEPFPVHMVKLFRELGMTTTHLDLNDTIIYHRSRNYCKGKNGYIVNTPYVDNSYKWAGGGFLSTVGDLLRFGNIMLYSLQYRPHALSQNPDTKAISSGENSLNKVESNATVPKGKADSSATEKQQKSVKQESSNHKTDEDASSNVELKKPLLPAVPCLPGLLKSETVEMLWSPVTTTENNGHYGMGWAVSPEKQNCAYCREQKYYASHSGGAIGASSILLILPRKCPNGETKTCLWSHPPKGIVVTLMTNLQGVSLMKTALEIANIFDQVEL